MESKFTGVYINFLRSRQLHVIYRDYFITFIQCWCTTLFFVKMDGGGGGGSVELSLRFIISSPTWPVLCFSVMCDLNLDNPGYQSLGAPPPAPPLHLVLHRTTRQTDAPLLHATGGSVRRR